MIRFFIFLVFLLSTNCFASTNNWECDYDSWGNYNVCRISIPHGWFVTNNPFQGGIVFYPDEKHEWKLK
jgi:hypothetical protein